MILVVGSFMTDLVVRMNNYPNSGQTIIGESFNTFLGGKGANQAIQAKRMGADVIISGCVGDDAFGIEFIKKFNQEGFDTKYILKSNKSSTGVGNIHINKEGQNKIVVVPGANMDYKVSDVSSIEHLIMDASVILCQLEMRDDVIYECSKYAKKYNKTFILNPAPAKKLDDLLLKNIDYLTPNETELEIISGMPCTNDLEIKKACESLIKRGVKNVIVTLGEKGSLLVNQNSSISQKAFLINPIDTVAAGDSFNGSLAYGLDNNLDINKCLIYSSASSALACLKNGAIPSLPTILEVKEFIKSREN